MSHAYNQPPVSRQGPVQTSDEERDTLPDVLCGFSGRMRVVQPQPDPVRGVEECAEKCVSRDVGLGGAGHLGGERSSCAHWVHPSPGQVQVRVAQRKADIRTTYRHRRKFVGEAVDQEERCLVSPQCGPGEHDDPLRAPASEPPPGELRLTPAFVRQLDVAAM